MMKKLLGVLFIFGLIFSTDVQAQYHLIWQDEFNYSGHLDSSKWNYETGGHGWGNNELQYYTEERLKNARVEDGKFIIETHKEYYKGNAYTSARVTTTNKGDWTYGRIEARAKLPPGRGTWPAIWMLPTEWIYGDGGWPDVGEIDVMEHVGYDPGVIHGTIHTNAFNHMDGTQRGETINVPDATSAFHVYAIEWDKDEIRWYVDDQHYFTFTNAGGWEKWPFDHPFHLIMNIAVGGDWGGAEGVDESAFPVQMEVDYVRVYQTSDQMSGLIEGPEKVPANAQEVSFRSKLKNVQSYAWSVPDGAEIVGPGDAREVIVNWGCAAGEINCAITTDGSVYEGSKQISLEPVTIEGPLFYNVDDSPLNFHVTPLHNTDFTWDMPEAAEILEGEGTNSINVDWPKRKDSIRLIINNNCVDTVLTRQVWDPGKQYPYPDPAQSHQIPDTLNPVNYDYGGEGIAYHDNDSRNQGNGKRQDEGVDTETRDEGTGNIGWIDDGEWIEYSIKVEEKMSAKVILRLASENDSPGSVDVLLNDEVVLSGINARNTGSWSDFEDHEAGIVTLDPADSILRVNFIRG